MRVGKYRKTVPARIVRLKHLTDQLAEKLGRGSSPCVSVAERMMRTWHSQQHRYFPNLARQPSPVSIDGHARVNRDNYACRKGDLELMKLGSAMLLLTLAATPVFAQQQANITLECGASAVNAIVFDIDFTKKSVWNVTDQRVMRDVQIDDLKIEFGDTRSKDVDWSWRINRVTGKGIFFAYSRKHDIECQVVSKLKPKF